MFRPSTSAVDGLGSGKDRQEGAGKTQTACRRHRLGEEICHCREKHREKYQAQADWQVHIAPPNVKRHEKIAGPWLLESQHDHRKRVEYETPHDTKRIRLAQKNDVAATG